MQFAVITHPREKKQVRSAYPFLKRFPEGLVARLLPYLPPVKIGEITTREGSAGDVIICPLLPHHFEHLAHKYLQQKINTCLKKAEKQGARVVGLEGLAASFLDGSQLQVNPIKASLTTGLRLRTQALFESVQLAARKIGIRWSQAEVVLVGPLGREGETWITLLARECRALTLLQTETGRGLEFVNKIMYETGLALKVTANRQLALAKADIVFIHHLDPAVAIDCTWFKPGSVVCSIIAEKDWGDKLYARNDVVYVADTKLIAPPGIAWTVDSKFLAGVSPLLAETIIMAFEQDNEWFCPGREITIRQVEDMARLAHKHGFQVSF